MNALIHIICRFSLAGEDIRFYSISFYTILFELVMSSQDTPLTFHSTIVLFQFRNGKLFKSAGNLTVFISETSLSSLSVNTGAVEDEARTLTTRKKPEFHFLDATLNQTCNVISCKLITIRDLNCHMFHFYATWNNDALFSNINHPTATPPTYSPTPSNQSV